MDDDSAAATLVDGLLVDDPPWRVPSEDYPTLAAAVLQATDGVHIELQPGHREELHEPLIIDKAVFIEGPTDCSALIVGRESIVVAAGATRNAVLLRRVRLRVVGEQGLVALVIAGGCTLEDCQVEATAVGVEVASHTGNAARLVRTVVRHCQVGISLPGGALAAVIEESQIEDCACGIAITGLDVDEGWNDVLASLAGVSFAQNSEADLRLKGWSIREKAAGNVRRAPPEEAVTVRGWPLESCNVVVPTDRGAVILHFTGGRVNAQLFEEEDEQGDDDSRGGSFNISPVCLEAVDGDIEVQESCLTES